MGLLWLGRNLMYQYVMFEYLLSHNENDDDIDEKHDVSPVQATQHAFQTVLKPHLNWVVSKIVQTAITALTPHDQCTFFTTLGGGGSGGGSGGPGNGNTALEETSSFSSYCEACRHDARELWNHWVPMFKTWNQILEDVRIETI